MTEPGSSAFLSRFERFETVDSTQRIVREWLEAGTPEVAVATADEQTAGRGRLGRGWTAPPGRALLVSAGFRPSGLPLHQGWRLAATASLAMLDAAEDAAGLQDDTLWLKWPNDIVAVGRGRAAAKGGRGPGRDRRHRRHRHRRHRHQRRLGRPRLPGGPCTVDEQPPRGRQRPARSTATQLLDGYLARLEPRYEALRDGHFDAGAWTRRQRTTGQSVEVIVGDVLVHGRATGVDPDSGALLVAGTPMRPTSPSTPARSRRCVS